MNCLLTPTVLFGAHCWGWLPGQQWGWLTYSCQQTTASIPKHSHTPIPLQAVTTGCLAVNNPVHNTPWMVNHREFPLNSMSHIERRKEIHRGGRSGGGGGVALAEVQVPEREKEEKGEKEGMGRQQAWWCSSTMRPEQLGPKPREDP